MTHDELNGMTVLQLRKLARENSVVLGSGIDKAGIIEKLLSVLIVIHHIVRFLLICSE